MMSRKAMVWWGAGAAVAAAIGVVVWSSHSEDRYSPGPKPMIPGVNGVPENGPIPPIFDDGDPAVAVGQVGSDWTDFIVASDGPYKWITIHVGESATLDGVTIALCAVWYNPGGDADAGPDEVGAPLVNPSRAYYLLSRDGSTPVCP